MGKQRRLNSVILRQTLAPARTPPRRGHLYSCTGSFHVGGVKFWLKASWAHTLAI